MKGLKTFLTDNRNDPDDDPVLDYLSEAVSVQDMEKVGGLIQSYFTRKLGVALVRLPGGEEYFNATGSGFGLRFFFKRSFKGFDSIRFNWAKKNVNSAEVTSVDLFAKGKNLYNINFDRKTSLVKVLPFVIQFMEKPQKGYVSKLSTMNEAVEGGNVIAKIDQMLRDNNVKKVSQSKLYTLIRKDMKDEKPTALSRDLFDVLKDHYPELLDTSGRGTTAHLGDGNLMKIADEVFDKMFTRGKATEGSESETYTSSPEAEELEQKGLDRLTFEQQLEDLRQSVKLLYGNITNAVFIGGRGGVGKTFNVEDVLESELGLVDGETYFKNAGSISAAGLYRLLFRKRKQLTLFDDSDNVFADQEARNILKGATDNKKKRKLAWSKQSSDIVPADEFSDENEDKGEYPSYFEYEGKIIFISNLQPDKLDPDGALRTRGILVNINPLDWEVYDLMRKIVDKFNIPEGYELSQPERLEVVDVLENDSPKKPDFRMLDRALGVRAGWEAGDDGWKRFVVYYA